MHQSMKNWKQIKIPKIYICLSAPPGTCIFDSESAPAYVCFEVTFHRGRYGLQYTDKQEMNRERKIY